MDAYIRLVVFPLVSLVWLTAYPAEDYLATDPCLKPSENAKRIISSFIKHSDEWVDNVARRDLAQVNPKSMDSSSSFEECRQLLRLYQEQILEKKDYDGEEDYALDVSFFDLEKYYAVVLVENINAGSESSTHPLEKVKLGRNVSIILYDSEINWLGAFNAHGFSQHHGNKITLQKESR